MLSVSYVVLTMCPLFFAQNSVLNGINRFTSQLVRNIERDNPTGNFVLSPISLHSTFSQVLIGAGGRTQAELEAVLGVSRSRRLGDQFSRISRNNPALKTANIMALNRGFTPAKSFVQLLKNGFGTDVKEYDMVNNKRRTVSEVNRIVASHTNNRILDLLTSEDINENTKMILINAVYFKANWKSAFNPQDSFTAEFQTPTLGKVMTKFMNLEMKARHVETGNLDILELPYEDRSTSMIFFLPKSGRSSSNIMDSIARYPLNTLKNVQKSDVVIAIPKFKIAFETKMKPEMGKLGMKELFTDNANLTYISKQRLKVSDGIHKAFIEVNEEGTEAAAATALLFGTRAGGTSKKRFFATRPFMFMVYDSVNNIPIFIGKITNPSSTNERQNTRENQNEFSKQTQSIKSPQSVPFQGNTEEKCKSYHDSFGVTVYTINECQRKTSSVKFQASCSDSQDLYDNFIKDNCGSSWCDYAAKNYVTWKEKFRAECSDKKLSKTYNCIKLTYDLKLREFLKCRF